MKTIVYAAAASICVAACADQTVSEDEVENAGVRSDAAETQEASLADDTDQLTLTTFDCGTIEVSDLDVFADDGSYAGQSDTFANTCYLIEHPNGESLLWDLGVPAALVGADPMVSPPFTVSLGRSLESQLGEVGADPTYVSVSHSHFDHVAQAAVADGATWLVHADELAHMKATMADDQTGGFAALMALDTETFTDEYDVFGDSRVRVVPLPGHTPGHTALLVDLEEEGPVLLTGDLYHREESREGRKVPRFNTDAAATRDSMERFEALAESMNARVIIQHEPRDVGTVIGETLR